MAEISEVRDTADKLSNPERAELAVHLLGGLEDTHYWVDDEEIKRRRTEMDSGEVEGISRAEFRRLASD